MVFFNQERVEQAQSMVGAAAAEYRVFQRGTQPWQRFARIQQLGFGAGEQVDIATDDAGDAGEGLHKVQRRAFAGEQNTRRAFQLEQRLVGFDRIAVGHVPGDIHVVTGELNKDLFHPAFATEDAIFTSNDHRMGACILRQ